MLLVRAAASPVPHAGRLGTWGAEHETHDWHTQIETWSDDGKLLHRFVSEDGAIMDHAFMDPNQRWLFTIQDDPNPNYELGLQLIVFPLGARTSELAWVDFDRSIPDTIHDVRSGTGSWRVDATTTWLADDVDDDWYESRWAFGLTILQAEPQPSFARIELLRDDEDAVSHEGFSLVAFGHHEGRAAVSWSGPGHPAAAQGTRGCELVDVSPDLDTELLRCGASLRVRRGERVHASALGPAGRWTWGRSGWLAIDHHPDHSALSPDGRRVAVHTQGTLRIFARDDGTLLTRWPVPPMAHLAFGQDGRFVLTGDVAPRAAWNSWTGEPAHALAELPDGQLDPAWRWLVSDRDDVVRVIDGLSLTIGPDWALLADGRFVGEPPSALTKERRFRVSEALAVPWVWTANPL